MIEWMNGWMDGWISEFYWCKKYTQVKFLEQAGQGNNELCLLKSDKKGGLFQFYHNQELKHMMYLRRQLNPTIEYYIMILNGTLYKESSPIILSGWTFARENL